MDTNNEEGSQNKQLERIIDLLENIDTSITIIAQHIKDLEKIDNTETESD